MEVGSCKMEEENIETQVLAMNSRVLNFNQNNKQSISKSCIWL